MRRLLVVAGLIGLLFACAGLVQIVGAHSISDWNGGRWLLFVAWLILTPMFLFVISLRSRTRRGARRRALERKQALDAEAARLRTPEGIRAIGGEEPPPAAPPV